LSEGGPELWIIAGANGSGKSTAYGQASIDAPTGSIWIINPDLLAQRIADHERLPLNPDANIAAVTASRPGSTPRSPRTRRSASKRCCRRRSTAPWSIARTPRGSASG
jgi:hypothetical protein